MKTTALARVSDKIHLADLSIDFAELELLANPSVVDQPDQRVSVKVRRATALDDQKRADFCGAQTIRYTVPGSEAEFVMENVRENPLRRAMFEVWLTLAEVENLEESEGVPAFPQMPASTIPFPVFETVWLGLDMQVAAVIHAACISVNQEWNDVGT